MPFNIEKIRADFPVLKGNHYLDSACMSLRPNQVVDKINEYYKEYPACAGRSYHKFGKKVTDEVEKARKIVKDFIGAKKEKEIIFSKNATESINLVANGMEFSEGDVVLTLDKEHNSNLLPWIKLKDKGVIHEIVETNDDNTFNMEKFEEKLDKHDEKVKLVAFGLTSNLDGVSIPGSEIVKKAHKAGALVLFDAAQTVPHHEVNVKKLDVDFLAFSGHKMCGPSGVGVLYGKEELLMKLTPMIVGGETVIDSTYDSFELEELPSRLEAGLQHYAGILGLGCACEYLKKIGMKEIEKHELKLNEIMSELMKLDKVEIIGPVDPKLRGGIFNFNIDGMEPHNIAMMLDESSNVMVRSGAHCVHSWFNAKGLKGSVRASAYFYNSEEDVRAFVDAVKGLVKDFS
ncbi:MAG: cysteine desulfurase [Nanoarchaeota archaeon]|nr:cysteine desulfurase [Nanoarchaeota archaeon]